MLTESTGIPPPNAAQGFEDFCHNVYSTICNDLTATKNGRSGQKQNGVDIFVRHGERRLGIQCKQKSFGKLTRKIIDDEVAAADKGVAIDELIIATTAANDAKLIAYAVELSDRRQQGGKFAVNLAFWDTLQMLVKSNPSLQWQFAPHMAGGAFFDIGRKLDEHTELLQLLANAKSAGSLAGQVSSSTIPDARLDSLNKLVDSQLDSVKKTLLDGRFDAALELLKTLGNNISAFDAHQHSRWLTQRAHCYWHQQFLELAAKDFDSAYELTPNDDKTASNRVRGALLRQQYDKALSLAAEARDNFPGSANVYSVWVEASERCGIRPDWERDVPPEFRDEIDVLFVCAWQALLAGELRRAVELAKKVAEKGTPTFEQAALLLLTLVNSATADGVLASAGIVSPKIQAELQEAMKYFEPIDQRIWERQDRLSTGQVVACLGYAHLLTGTANAAKEILLKGVERFPQDGQLTRIALEAIAKADGNITGAYKFGADHLDTLDDQGKLMVAEMAAEYGDLATFERAKNSLENGISDQEREEELRAFEWLALVSSGNDKNLNDVLTFEAFRSLTSIVARVIVANLAHRRELAWAIEAVHSLSKDLDDGSSSRDIIMVSRACVAVGLYSEAAKRLAKILPPGGTSELHKLLFEALVKGGARRKALRILQEFPPSALDSSEIRTLALTLAEDANDWNELSRLSALQLEAHPDRAEAWTFRASVLLRQRQTQAMRRLIREDIPLTLKGSAKSRAQLARFEIEFGNLDRGFNRLYQVYRCQLADVDMASLYLGHIFSIQPERRPGRPLTVGPATAVSLSSNGTSRQLVVDPECVALPKAAQFISTADAPYQALAGRAVGDTVQIVDSFGIPHDYTITGIDSAYLHLAGRAENIIHESVVPGGPLVSIEMPTTADGKLDLSHMLSMLKARSDRVKIALDGYGQGQATIGVVAKLLGVSPVLMAADWPVEPAPKLYACSGTLQERSETEKLLDAWKGPLVVDLTAVNELVSNDMEAALGLVQPVFISTSSVEALDALITSAATDRAVGHMKEENGRIAMVQYGEGYHEGRRAYLERLRNCIEEYCEVVPAWGVDDLPGQLADFAPLLGNESYDSLLLCLEKDALLLTLDGRLRDLGKVVANIRGAWPQVFCSVASLKGICTADSCHRFVISSIARRRFHTSITSADVIWTLSGASAATKNSFGTLLQYIADSSVEALSTARVIADAVVFLLVRGGTLLAICRFIEAAFAPIFARHDVNGELLENLLTNKLLEVTSRLFDANTANIYIQAVHEEERDNWASFITRAIRDARHHGDVTPLAELCNKTAPVTPLYVSTDPVYVAKF